MRQENYWDTQEYRTARGKTVTSFIERSGHLSRTSLDDLTGQAMKLLGGFIHYRMVINEDQYWDQDNDEGPKFVPTIAWIKRCKELGVNPDTRTWNSNLHNHQLFLYFHKEIARTGIAFLPCHPTTETNTVGVIGVSLQKSLKFFASEMTNLRCEQIYKNMNTEFDKASEAFARDINDYYQGDLEGL